MKHLSWCRILYCLAICFAILLWLAEVLAVWCIAPVLEAPFALLFQPESCGRKIGEIIVRRNEKNRLFKVYASQRYFYHFRSIKTGKCLLLYPENLPWTFPQERAFKVTENSVGVFNDAPWICLHMGKYFYECARSLPVYSVNDDMKGLGAPFQITRTQEGFFYSIPSESISFTVPVSFFDSLK